MDVVTATVIMSKLCIEAVIGQTGEKCFFRHAYSGCSPGEQVLQADGSP